MKQTNRTIYILLILCIVAVNVTCAIGLRGRGATPAGRAGLALPLAATNLLLVTTFIVVKATLDSRRRHHQRLERRCQTVEMISEDQQVEAQILGTISDLSNDFLDKMEIGPLLDQMSDAVHHLLQVDISVIHLLPGSAEEGLRFVRGAAALDLGTPAYDEVIGNGKSVLINNLARYPQYSRLTEQGVRSVILAPLTLHKRTIGLLCAASKTNRNFTSRDLRQLFSFANHAALMIETTQLLHSVRQLSTRDGATVGDLRGLKEYLSYERRLQEREMEVARRIQVGLLPRDLPAVNLLEVEGSSLPAKEVGGDYYDVLDLGGGRWGVAIGDVSGKGVPAALVMVMTRTLLHGLASSAASPSSILAGMNATLYHETDPSVFVSMLYGVWDSRAGAFTYSNAGHEPPILLEGGRCRSLPTGGVALGAMEEVADVLHDETVPLGTGAALLLYTDGATEAMNARREMFGVKRLRQALEHAAGGNHAMLPPILRKIEAFADGTSRHDDITMVCMRRSSRS